MEIRWEFSIGQNRLPMAYSVLFTGQVQRLLKYDGINKNKWLISVWNAQDWVRITAGLGGWEINKTTENFIQRNKKNRKRKLEEWRSLLLVA